ncbi:Protein of unknown function [Chitinophaga sp. YR573]|uniref:phage protein Gp36 family protein n=1 Tax=Chitinophaga sp. YR573 TaxID=1881040 RepID=UPI0008BD9DF2|nr:phage protein Gp36 family protein [Chitinophaga sp. YR573]SEW02046.1 Protein of unknown function [Chitinophaga sp. YR573]
MFLELSELSTHAYKEVMDEISRDDDTIPEDAINAAIEEARGYLTAYDVDAIFSATGDNRNPVLLLYIKDIAIWHFINLANVAIEMELRSDRYDKAIKWLEKVQSGKTNPSLPLPAPPVGDNNFIKWGGNQRRGSHY